MNDGITGMHGKESKKSLWRSPDESINTKRAIIALHPDGHVYLASPILYGNKLSSSCCKGWIYGDDVFALISNLMSERAEMIGLLRASHIALRNTCSLICRPKSTITCKDCSVPSLIENIYKAIKKAEASK